MDCENEERIEKNESEIMDIYEMMDVFVYDAYCALREIICYSISVKYHHLPLYIHRVKERNEKCYCIMFLCYLNVMKHFFEHVNISHCKWI